MDRLKLTIVLASPSAFETYGKYLQHLVTTSLLARIARGDASAKLIDYFSRLRLVQY